MYLVRCSFGVLSVVPNFVRLFIFEILGNARDTDEGFALVARFLHDSRLMERSAAGFAQEQPSTEYRRRPRVRYIPTQRVWTIKPPAVSLCLDPGWSVHIQPAIERTVRIQAEELGGELHSTPRSLEEEAVRHRSAVPQRRLLFEMCVLAVPMEGASHKRPRDGPKNLSEILGRTPSPSKSTLSLPLQRGRLFVTSKRNCASPFWIAAQSPRRILRTRRKHHHSLPLRGSVVPASLTGHPIPRLFFLEQVEV